MKRKSQKKKKRDNLSKRLEAVLVDIGEMIDIQERTEAYHVRNAEAAAERRNLLEKVRASLSSAIGAKAA